MIAFNGGDGEWDDGETSSRWTAVKRFLLVLAMVLAAFLLSVVPVRLGAFDDVRPPFLLMVVYYWAIYRPSLIPPVLAFALGLLADLIAVLPLGLSALLLVSAQWVVRGQRRFLLGQAFLVIWAVYALVAAAAGLAQWLLFCLFHVALVPIMPVVVGTTLSVLLFPLVVLPLSLINKALAESAAKK